MWQRGFNTPACSFHNKKLAKGFAFVSFRSSDCHLSNILNGMLSLQDGAPTGLRPLGGKALPYTSVRVFVKNCKFDKNCLVIEFVVSIPLDINVTSGFILT